jgi:hypothetical protein
MGFPPISRQWDVENGETVLKLIKKSTGHEWVYAVVYSTDTTRLGLAYINTDKSIEWRSIQSFNESAREQLLDIM